MYQTVFMDMAETIASISNTYWRGKRNRKHRDFKFIMKAMALLSAFFVWEYGSAQGPGKMERWRNLHPENIEMDWKWFPQMTLCLTAE